MVIKGVGETVRMPLPAVSPTPIFLKKSNKSGTLLKKKNRDIVDVIMANGQYYSSGFNDFMSLMSLRSKRFHTLNIPNDFKFSILEHTAICGLLVTKYCDYMANRFYSHKIKKGSLKKIFTDSNTISQIYQAVLCHDIEESIIGDIPSPVEISIIEKSKQNIRENIMNFLKINEDNTSVIMVAIKHIDVVAALIELMSYEGVINSYQKVNMFKYYFSKIDKYEIKDFLKEISVDLFNLSNDDMFK